MLKKYPNLLKEGKNVKLKVVGKDCNGRPVVKHITLKAAAASSASAVAMKKQPYSARRGRPKRVRDGEGEETELHKRTEVFATLDQVAAGATAEVGGGAQHRQQRQQQQEEQRMDSSSEAEALSNVASGIAASLGLAAGNLDHEGRVTAAAVVVPTSAEDGGESSGGGGGGGEVSELGQQETAIMIDYQDHVASAAATASAPAGGGGGVAQVILASDGPVPAGAVQILHDGSISLTSPGVIIAEHPGTSQGATVEAAMAKLHGGEAAATTVATVEPMGGTKKKLEMDWEEEEEEEEGQEGNHAKKK